MHNDLVLPVTQGGFSGDRDEEGIVYIIDTSLIKYMPKHMNKISSINKITRVCETFISDIFLQSD